MNLQPYEGLPRQTRRKMVARALVRALITSALLVTAYYVLPLEHLSGTRIAFLVVGIAALVVLIGWQVRAILHAPYPVAQAIESLAVSTPLFLLLFASTYYVLGHATPSDFSQQMTRTDALYFTMTTFSTTGFGDITAKSEGARLIVTGQMLLDLILLGFGVRVFVGAVRLGQEARRGGGEQPDPSPG